MHQNIKGTVKFRFIELPRFFNKSKCNIQRFFIIYWGFILKKFTVLDFDNILYIQPVTGWAVDKHPFLLIMLFLSGNLPMHIQSPD